jgi:hypothetical protein
MTNSHKPTRMLISKSEDRWKEIDAAKVAAGSYLTTASTWLLPQVRQFLINANPAVVLDPFAGNGDLLKAVSEVFACEFRGFDIDKRFGWPLNDSLSQIPEQSRCLILTNPPYLAKHSAKRKRVYHAVESHFVVADDLYKVAITRCLEAAEHVVAIVPETFLNSEYSKAACHSITIVLKNPFEDTECPVCVLCMSRHRNPQDATAVFVDSNRVASWQELDARRLKPANSVDVIFNHKAGRVALKAVDGVREGDRIRFIPASEFGYLNEIKHSSRLMTRIEIPRLSDGSIDQFIRAINARLERFRTDTHDLLLSPFKGNTHSGERRRRLDYFTARALAEDAFWDLAPPMTKGTHQLTIPGFA